MDGFIASKVTRNSANADVLREACRAAAARGVPFKIIESFTVDEWWTEFSIAKEFAVYSGPMIVEMDDPK